MCGSEYDIVHGLDFLKPLYVGRVVYNYRLYHFSTSKTFDEQISSVLIDEHPTSPCYSVDTKLSMKMQQNQWKLVKKQNLTQRKAYTHWLWGSGPRLLAGKVMSDNSNKVISMYHRVMVKSKLNKFAIICDDKMQRSWKNYIISIYIQCIIKSGLGLIWFWR